jgi:hypothetical protein
MLEHILDMRVDSVLGEVVPGSGKSEIRSSFPYLFDMCAI